MSWLLSNNQLEKVYFVSVQHTSSNPLLLSSQDKGCKPSVAHPFALILGPALTCVMYILVYLCMNIVITCYHLPLITCSKLIQKTMNKILGMLLILNILIINLNLGTNLFVTKELNLEQYPKSYQKF